ncbi:ABC transporter ATP-binding protein [Nostoc linckia FACHB-104]|nr:ABC transporter ATP-binding protein [Nostoc linckia FACHB-104]
MGDEIAISLKNVSKCYKRYARPIDRLKEILIPKSIHSQEFWALKDINLELYQGETLGIIGQNGSGKSTLLQIIARTLTPTTGEVIVNGRVSALLELGSGFNPEFTGRQNVFFNGQILGLNKEEIEHKFIEIEKFADIGSFIDQPVKTYSSGMFVRLAFAVAVNVNPEILIVDEALAVGDIYFQQKCYERIRNLRDVGTTLLFVSHDSTAVHKLCSRALLLEAGKLILDAQPKQVIDLYEAKLLQKNDIQPDAVKIDIISEDGARKLEQESSLTSAVDEVVINAPDVRIKFIRFLDEQGEEILVAISEQLLQLSIGILFLKSYADPHIGFKIREKTGEVIFETNTWCMGKSIGRVDSATLVETCFRFYVPLMEGEYTITFGIADGVMGESTFERTLLYAHNVSVLKVLKNTNSIRWSGIVNLSPTVSIDKQIYV